MIERHRGGIAHHVDGRRSKDLSLARWIHLGTEETGETEGGGRGGEKRKGGVVGKE